MTQNIGALLAAAFDRYHSLVVDCVQADGFADVTPAQAKVIAHMGKDPVKAVTLAARVGVSKQALSLMAAELVQKGYLAHQPDPKDRRAKLLALSQAGHQVKAAGDRARAKAQDTLMAPLSEAEQATLISCLNRALEPVSAPPFAQQPEATAQEKQG